MEQIKHIVQIIVIILLGTSPVYAQGVFESNSTNGVWKNSASWNLTGGTDMDGVPDEDDSVIIHNGHSIEIKSNASISNLTFQGGILVYKKNVTLSVTNNVYIHGDVEITGNSEEQKLDILNNLIVIPNTNLSIGGLSFSVSGQSEVSGGLTFSGGGQPRSFGDLLILEGGHFESNDKGVYVINGNLVNDGSFSSNDVKQVFYFKGSTGSIAGSGTINLNNVLINSPSNYTNTGDLVVHSSLRGSGAFFNGTNGSLTFIGSNGSANDFDIANFSASAVDNTVEFAGDFGVHYWRPTITAANDYYNVIINITGGAETIKLVENVKVNGELAINSGNIKLGDYDLELSPEAKVTNAGPDGFIMLNKSGVVRQYYDSLGGTVFIPIGDVSGRYSPIQEFTLLSGNLNCNAHIDFSVRKHAHPNRNTANIALGGDDDGAKAKDYIRRYWTLSSNSITNPRYDVAYTYVESDVKGNEENLVGTLYRVPPGYFFKDWYEKGIVNSTDNIVQITGADGFGDLYAMDNTDSRLPVELISFTARAFGSRVALNWTTASELNNEFFYVQRSIDGELFETIAMVKGAGNSNEQITYQAYDDRPVVGRLFYRLKQTDLNGNFEYSEIQSVFVDADVFSELSVEVYPNPVNRGEALNIKFKGLIESGTQTLAELYNLTGQKVFFKKMSGKSAYQNRIEIPGNIKKGLYILRVTSGFEKVDKRIIVN